MKKIICALLALTLLLGLLAGCGPESEEDKLSIVTTIFPEYDWIRQILGEKADEAELTMLLDSGIDLHSYQPSMEDILKISTCDLFIYVGGESDSWVDNALKTSKNENRVVINLLEILGDAVKEEERVEGMETPDDHDHDHEAEGPEYDEHVWLSLNNAKIICRELTEKLSALTPDNTSTYRTNADAYLTELSELDERYRNAVNEAKRNTVLFADRFPFRYLTDDYDLNYYAAFVGCSADTKASFETIAFLAGKVDELGLKTVLIIEKSDDSIARTVIENTKAKDAQIKTVNSIQSITSEDIEKGVTYLSLMESNLVTLTAALQ